MNQAIWLLVTGAREAAFRNIKTIAECLADELINAGKVLQFFHHKMYKSLWLTSAVVACGIIEVENVYYVDDEKLKSNSEGYKVLI